MSGAARGPSHADAVAPTGPGEARRTVDLFGLTIDALSMAETIERIDRLIAAGGVHQHVSVNVDKVVKARHDPSMVEIINASEIVTADGQPIIWASRLLGRPLPERVAGIDLMQRLIAHAARVGLRVYYLGARDDVVGRVIDRVCREHPGAVVAGGRDGYWRADEDPDVAREVAASRPDILFLALPSPAKERFLNRWKDSLGARFVMGVGGSFDVYAGMTPRAPRVIQQVGLEWLYRLAQEPRRMWRRYLVDDLQFLPILVGEWWRLRRPRPADGARQLSTPAKGSRRHGPPRILVVSNLYSSPRHPSFGTFIAARVQALQNAGADVEVQAIRDAGVHRRIAVKYLRLTGGTLVAGMRLAARRRRLDAVEAHIAFPTGWIAWPVALLHRAPLVLFVHGADVADISRRSRLHALAARTLFRLAALVVVNSEYMARQLEEVVVLAPDKVVVRSPGIDHAAFAHPRGVGTAGSRSGLLFVGRLDKVKGVHVLLEALQTLRLRGHDVALEMIGDGPERAAIKASAASLGLPVDLRGGQSPAAVAAAMQAADVLVVPSSYAEPLGLVAIEGMAAGTVVVASNTGGLAETISDGETGILVAPGSAAALVEGLERALAIAADPVARGALAARAREVASAHDIRSVAARSIEDYRKLGARS